VLRAQGYGGGEAVDVVSHNFNYARCDVPWRDARLVRQLSDTACIRGQNWGMDRGGLWVDRGCGGRFIAAGGYHAGGGHGGGWHPGPGWDTRFVVGCASEDYRYRFCAVDLGRRRSRLRQPEDIRCPMHRGTHLGLESGRYLGRRGLRGRVYD
jgi:hypothetical protein